MSKTRCEAVVMGYGGGDSRYRFEMEGDPMDRPADEAVEALMDHLHATGFLASACDDELDSAMKNQEHGIVLALGSLKLKRDTLPFAAFISKV